MSPPSVTTIPFVVFEYVGIDVGKPEANSVFVLGLVVPIPTLPELSLYISFQFADQKTSSAEPLPIISPKEGSEPSNMYHPGFAKSNCALGLVE